MPATTEQTHELEHLEAEASFLETQHQQAQLKTERGQRRTREIRRRIDELAVERISDSGIAEVEAEGLEAELLEVKKTISIAEAAAVGFQKELDRTRDDLRLARKEAAKERYNEILATIPAQRLALEEAAKELKRGFRELSNTRQKLLQEANNFMEYRAAESLQLYAPTDEAVNAVRRLLRNVV